VSLWGDWEWKEASTCWNAGYGRAKVLTERQRVGKRLAGARAERVAEVGHRWRRSRVR
jgi:hypothetical protein